MANQLNLTGGVRNLHDGRVEVQVSGEQENVQSLIKWLKIGPNLAKVSNIEVMTIKVLALPSDQASGQQNKSFDVWPSL